MLHRNRAILAIAIVSALAIGLAACGGSSSSDSTTAASASSGKDTIGTSMISGTGNVLVDSKGAALYTNNMDSANEVACTGQCLTEWLPLAAPSAGNPTSSDSAVQSMLGTTQGSDGSTQVTFGGKPLYTFSADTPGQVTGNGFSDSFGGTHFVWTAATVGGSSAGSAPPATTQGASGGNSSGGY